MSYFDIGPRMDINHLSRYWAYIEITHLYRIDVLYQYFSNTSFNVIDQKSDKLTDKINHKKSWKEKKLISLFRFRSQRANKPINSIQLMQQIEREGIDMA
jgi:hypothetical protein